MPKRRTSSTLLLLLCLIALLARPALVRAQDDAPAAPSGPPAADSGGESAAPPSASEGDDPAPADSPAVSEPATPEESTVESDTPPAQPDDQALALDPALASEAEAEAPAGDAPATDVATTPPDGEIETTTAAPPPEGEVVPAATDPAALAEDTAAEPSGDSPAPEALDTILAVATAMDNTSAVVEAAAVLPQESAIVVVDAQGEALPLASQEAAAVLAVPDPYYTVDGVTYTYRSDCSGVSHCTVVSNDNAIQAAVDGFISRINAGGASPDNTIYVEAGTYGGAVVDGASFTGGAPASFSLLGSGSGSATINGGLALNNLVSPTLQGFTINGWVYLSGNSGDVTLNDLVVTNPWVTMHDIPLPYGGHGINLIDNDADIEINNITANNNNIEAGTDGAGLVATLNNGDLRINSSTFNNNSGNGLWINEHNGLIKLLDVDANSNGYDTAEYYGFGAEIIGGSGDIQIGNSILGGTFNNNKMGGLLVHGNYEGNVEIYNSTFNANGRPVGGIYINSDNVDSIRMFNVTANDNVPNGIYISGSKKVTLSSVFANNNGHGTQINSGVGNEVEITVQNSIFNWNDVGGIAISGYGKSNFTLNNIYASQNGSTGIQIWNEGGSTINMADVNSSDNSYLGIGLFNQFENINIQGSTINSNLNDGLYYGANYNRPNTSSTGYLNIRDTQINNNNEAGLVVVDHNGTISLNNIIASQNMGPGASINRGSGAIQIGNSLVGGTFNANGGTGFVVTNHSGGLALYNTSFNGNGAGGLSTANGTAGNLYLYNVTASSNTGDGLWMNNQDGAINLVGVSASNNTSNGAVLSTANNQDINIRCLYCGSFNSNGGSGVVAKAGSGTVTISRGASYNNRFVDHYGTRWAYSDSPCQQPSNNPPPDENTPDDQPNNNPTFTIVINDIPGQGDKKIAINENIKGLMETNSEATIYSIFAAYRDWWDLYGREPTITEILEMIQYSTIDKIVHKDIPLILLGQKPDDKVSQFFEWLKIAQ